MNNYERIKKMTVDEMARFLNDPPCLPCEECAHENDCRELDIHCPTMNYCYLIEWLERECDNV